MQGGSIIKIVQIAGNGIIVEGINWLSRGNNLWVMMKRIKPLLFFIVPEIIYKVVYLENVYWLMVGNVSRHTSPPGLVL